MNTPNSTDNLKHHFLLAMPQLNDPWFGAGLVYICEHNAQGAMGIVINKPHNMLLAEVFNELNISAAYRKQLPVYNGGPVSQEQGFILYRADSPAPGSSLPIAEHIYLSTSREILEELARGTGPVDVMVCLGYAGWEPGQLENEIAANSWLTVPADGDIMFNLPPAEKLQAAARLLGIDLAMLSSEAGHG